MINHKSKSKTRKGPYSRIYEGSMPSPQKDSMPQRESSKVFKKLSMSFYNWSTKNNNKQVVCEDFNVVADDHPCKSVRSLSPEEDVDMKERMSKKTRPSSQGKTKKATNKTMFCHWASKPLNANRLLNIKKTRDYEQYLHMEQTPLQVTQFYYRHYKPVENSPNKHTSSIKRNLAHRSSVKESNRRSQKKRACI